MSGPAGSGRPDRAGRVAGLLLAAGPGSRMGGPSKLLLQVDGRPLVRWSALAAVEAGLDPVIAVVGHGARPISEALSGLGVRVVRNRAWRRGQGTSLALGFRALAGHEDVIAAAVLLGDEPEIDVSVIRRAVEAWRRSDRPILRCMYSDRPGHPVVLGRDAFLGLRRLNGDEGALSGARIPAHRVESLRVDGSAPRDVDEPADYRGLVDRGLRGADPEGT